MLTVRAAAAEPGGGIDSLFVYQGRATAVTVAEGPALVQAEVSSVFNFAYPTGRVSFGFHDGRYTISFSGGKDDRPSETSYRLEVDSVLLLDGDQQIRRDPSVGSCTVSGDPLRTPAFECSALGASGPYLVRFEADRLPVVVYPDGKEPANPRFDVYGGAQLFFAAYRKGGMAEAEAVSRKCFVRADLATNLALSVTCAALDTAALMFDVVSTTWTGEPRSAYFATEPARARGLASFRAADARMTSDKAESVFEYIKRTAAGDVAAMLKDQPGPADDEHDATGPSVEHRNR